MRFVTHCPTCSTLFRVVPDQLRIAQGWVRCGQCQTVYRAIAHLLLEEPEPDSQLASVEPADTQLDSADQVSPAPTVKKAESASEEDQVALAATQRSLDRIAELIAAKKAEAWGKKTKTSKRHQKLQRENTATPAEKDSKTVFTAPDEARPAEAGLASSLAAAELSAPMPTASENSQQPEGEEDDLESSATTLSSEVDLPAEEKPEIADSLPVNSQEQPPLSGAELVENAVVSLAEEKTEQTQLPSAQMQPAAPEAESEVEQEQEQEHAARPEHEEEFLSPPTLIWTDEDWEREKTTSVPMIFIEQIISENSKEQEQETAEPVKQAESSAELKVDTEEDQQQAVAATPASARAKAPDVDAGSQLHKQLRRKKRLDRRKRIAAEAAQRESLQVEENKQDTAVVEAPSSAESVPDDTPPLCQSADDVKKAADVPADAAVSDLSFMRAAQKRTFWAQTKVRAVLLSVLSLACLILAGQVLFHYRSPIYAQIPLARMGFDAICRKPGCSIPPWKHIDAVSIASSNFHMLSEQTYRFDISLRNASIHPVAMPALDLSLLDDDEQVVIRRIIANDPSMPAPEILTPRGEWNGSLRLTVRLPDDVAKKNIAGYRVAVFYP